MNTVVVIGDELSCAGFRLAGARTRNPAPADLEAEFERALAGAPLVVLTRRSAEALPPAVLRRAALRETPLVVVMPELASPVPDRGFVRRMRAVLGIET